MFLSSPVSLHTRAQQQEGVGTLITGAMPLPNELHEIILMLRNSIFCALGTILKFWSYPEHKKKPSVTPSIWLLCCSLGKNMAAVLEEATVSGSMALLLTFHIAACIISSLSTLIAFNSSVPALPTLVPTPNTRCFILTLANAWWTHYLRLLQSYCPASQLHTFMSDVWNVVLVFINPNVADLPFLSHFSRRG